MNNIDRSFSSRSLLLSLVCIFALNRPALATAPVIAGISVLPDGPQLSIRSDLGVTNQIQCLTNLAENNWSVITNVAVSQSPYFFIDAQAGAASQRFYRVLTLIPSTPIAPAGMVYIPSGSFEMGDTYNEGDGNELPVHTAYVSAFFMDKYEVSQGLWQDVKTWSETQGYSYDNSGLGSGTNYPIRSINWYDMVKWCNARSEKEGRTPCYYTDAELTQVYRSGQAEPFVKWNAGYRLPAEAEWEKGARGGASGHRFPWTDVETITEERANYYSDHNVVYYDVNLYSGFNEIYPDTSPIGSFPPNGYGLYDMAGNVWEWCWDWLGSYPSDPQTDPHGPATGSTRIGRGGNWNFYAVHCRCAYRYGNSPTYFATNIGFRCAIAAP